MPPARFLYTAAMFAALPIVLPYLAKKRRLNRECFGFAPPQLSADDSVAKDLLAKNSAALKNSAAAKKESQNNLSAVWVHSVSVGEAVAAAGIVEFLKSQNCRIVLTYTTAAGGEQLRARHGRYAHICRLPLDLPFAVSRFLRRIRPQLAVFVEAEYWPNTFAALRAADVPILIANARLGKQSARRRIRFASLMKETAAAISAAAAQTRADMRRLKFFGVQRAIFAGNLKFDRAADDAKIKIGEEWRRRRTNKLILLVAGSRPGEEELLLREFGEDFLRQFFVVIAPRHPERGDEIAAMLSRRKILYSRRSQNDAPDPRNADMHLADTLGEMDSFYAFCDIALIGGGFLPFGGQNPIEAMAAGVAAVVGPHSENYRALVAEAAKCGALQQAKDAANARRKILSLAENADLRIAQAQSARKLCQSHRGALQTNAKLAAELLPPPAQANNGAQTNGV